MKNLLYSQGEKGVKGDPGPMGLPVSSEFHQEVVSVDVYLINNYNYCLYRGLWDSVVRVVVQVITESPAQW